MCGLAGSLLSPDCSISALARVKEIFIANLLANEERGREATGVAACGFDGTFFVEKAAVPAHVFVKSEPFRRFMAQAIDTQTAIILGHTRDPTKGTTRNNLNNHPIIVGSTVGIHNGVISNDDEIFGELGQESAPAQRLGAVDSEAIMALFDRVTVIDDLHGFIQGVQGAVQLLAGSFTTLFFNTAAPQRLVCLRYDNPISSFFDIRLQTFFFSSRYLFLRKTFGRAAIARPMSARTGFIYEASSLAEYGGTPLAQFDL